MALVRMLDEVSAFLAREHGHYIDGRAVAGRGERIDVRDPMTSKPRSRRHIARFAASGPT